MKRVILIIILSIPLFLSAQIPPGGGDPGGDPDVPISGIEWLLITGGIFGASRLFRGLKKNQH